MGNRDSAVARTKNERFEEATQFDTHSLEALAKSPASHRPLRDEISAQQRHDELVATVREFPVKKSAKKDLFREGFRRWQCTDYVGSKRRLWRAALGFENKWRHLQVAVAPEAINCGLPDIAVLV